MRDVNSFNKVILIGRLGQKPEVRVLPQRDRSMARFSLATNERSWNPNTNESTMRTEWHRIVSWGKQAEFCERFLEQGKQVLVEGKLRTRSWQDRDGNKRSTTEIEAFNIVLLGRREGEREPDHYGPPTPASQAEPAVSEFPGPSEEEPPAGETGGDDDIPF